MLHHIELTDEELGIVSGGELTLNELTDEELSTVSGGVQYGDIKGEATSEGHTKWIQL